ncbi:DUF1311 domain-containing protein [Rhodovulum sp. 12E13]|uniref:lysozyme inhibitor LprI family protein n=1 Tax=Rhodovulum sp. 12E13 TaxID=2203891 RepID=UPI000E142F24|nr:lysozyme inhibitor LprI family protein [Rhodovulum sp. 12E13]RDC71936.1 DUF1311 domain-containing protein [Rhodovulum sp. 12E13]
MRCLVALALLAAPTAAQQQPDPAFDIVPTRDCIEAGGARACIGRAAESCQAQPGGETTVVMSFCFWKELEWWDARLNAVYGRLMAQEQRIDAEIAGLSDAPPASRADALRAMQRAWIPFRDAACDYERSQWGGGTGGGPATYACLMHETARQTLRLERTLGAEAPVVGR